MGQPTCIIYASTYHLAASVHWIDIAAERFNAVQHGTYEDALVWQNEHSALS